MGMFRILLLVCLPITSFGAEPPSGDSVIRGKFGCSDIVITTTNRLAGAIHSLTWDGQEFIDSADHGRQLQSACSFDCGKPGKFWAEAYNPTEAGSRRDGDGATSSSKLLELKAGKNELSTRTQMAFWLAPGEKSDAFPALNDKALSAHTLAKRVTIGYQKFPNVLEYCVTFAGPKNEAHTYAQYEALTGYMPPEFSRFHTWNPKDGRLVKLSDGPGEQALPVVVSKPDGKHAMAVWSPAQPAKGYEAAGYGRFRFAEEKVVKWNCVFRFKDAGGVKLTEKAFRIFVVVGTLDDMPKTLAGLVQAVADEKR